MIYAFEEYQRNDKYDIDEEKRERIREGMQLFIDYYRNVSINRSTYLKGYSCAVILPL